MYGFQHFLQSLFVIAACASDYFLVFDLWIITPAVWKLPRGSTRARQMRIRLIGVAKLALGYALIEPLWYYAYFKLTSQALFPFFMACFVYIPVASLTFNMVISGVESLKKEHEELCGFPLGGSPANNSTAEHQQDSDSNAGGRYKDANSGDDEENEKLNEGHTLLKEDGDLGQSADRLERETGDSSSKTQASLGPHCPHEPSLVWKLARVPPVIGSAAVNAGLLFFVRFFGSKYSEDWIIRFAFGWTAVTLLGFFFLTITKGLNVWVGRALFRQPLTLGKRENWIPDLLIRGAGFLILHVVRSSQRIIFGFQPIAMPAIQSNINGTSLVLSSDIEFGSMLPGNGTENATNHAKKPLDSFLANIPPWVGIAANTINIIMGIGVCVYGYMYRQQRKRNAEASV